MHRFIACAATVALVLVACGPEDQPAAGRSQKELAQLAFEALRADDPARLAGAVVSADDVEWTLQKMAESAPDQVGAARKNLESAGGADTAVAGIRAGAEASLARARELSVETFDWAAASFLGVDLDHTRVRTEFGYETADIWFGVKAGETTYEFVLTRCLSTPSGWKTGGAIHFPEKDPELPSASAQRRMVAQLRSLEQALKLHVTMHQTLPETLEVLLQPDPHSGEALLDEIPQDPWGNALQYERTEDGKFRLHSAGPDGEMGTDDDVVFPGGRVNTRRERPPPRQLLVLLPCVLVLLAGGCGERRAKGPQSPEQLARLAFEALRANELERLLSVVPTADDVEWMVARAQAIDPDEAARMEQELEERGGATAFAETIRDSAETAFRRARREGAEAFEWATATFLELDPEQTRFDEQLGVDQGDVWFRVAADGVLHRFRLNTCLHLPAHWVVAEGVHYDTPR